MDAHAHLLSLGWAGPGHSLDSTPYKQKGHRGLAYDPAKVGNTGNGLVKPLSISLRKGRLGIGKKAHEPSAGNEWWLKGFESALGNVGKSESERSSGASTPAAREYSGKHAGLYSFFIKGQEMQGTIGEMQGQRIERSWTKQENNVLDEPSGDITFGAPKHESTSEFEQAAAFFALRDKDEKRKQRTRRASPVEEFEHIGKYLEERIEKHKKKKRKSEALDSETNAALETDQPREDETDRAETREERRERRRRQREEKEQRRKALVALESQHHHDSKIKIAQGDAARAAEKAERKRRKVKKTGKISPTE